VNEREGPEGTSRTPEGNGPSREKGIEIEGRFRAGGKNAGFKRPASRGFGRGRPTHPPFGLPVTQKNPKPRSGRQKDKGEKHGAGGSTEGDRRFYAKKKGQRSKRGVKVNRNKGVRGEGGKHTALIAPPTQGSQHLHRKQKILRLDGGEPKPSVGAGAGEKTGDKKNQKEQTKKQREQKKKKNKRARRPTMGGGGPANTKTGNPRTIGAGGRDSLPKNQGSCKKKK